jgi:hypothetical protein
MNRNTQKNKTGKKLDKPADGKPLVVEDFVDFLISRINAKD